MITQEKVRLLDTLDLESAVENYPQIPPRKDGTRLDLDERILLATITRDDFTEYVDLLGERITRHENRAAAAREAADYLVRHGAATTGELLDRLDMPELKHFHALLTEAIEEDETP